ncbi:MAG: GDP-mannose 4,6-dehydratase [candidate division Zixibacteria bacterium]|nr:GDP-mannose 4,6-dehydratase [candidate division Zixibacteria bacterium]
MPIKKATVFITGIAGFAGSYLAEELLATGYRVVGAVHPKESTANIAGLRGEVDIVRLDIQNPSRCRQVLLKAKPDYVCHLAAIASVWRSFEMERTVYRVNFEGTLNMLEATLETDRLRRFLFVSSADCYGVFTPRNKTLTEEQPLNPVSPYALSKAVAEQACRYYAQHYRLPIVTARPFAHSGPRQSADFVIPSFTRQIATIEAGRSHPVMAVGNLTAKRDLSDVRDIVRGYRLLIEKGRPGRVYQLCSGRAVTIQTVLNSLLRLSSRNIKVRVDRSRLRKIDIPIQRGDNSRAVQELGYHARYKLRTTLKDTLDFWRKKTNS